MTRDGRGSGAMAWRQDGAPPVGRPLGPRPRRAQWGSLIAGLLVLLGIAVVAPRALSSRSIDGIGCVPASKTVLPLHQHLTIEIAGQPLVVPAGIGDDTGHPLVSCLYWLHTHDTDGVIHIESPVRRAYTLGQFFAVWGQPLGRAQILSLRIGGAHRLRVYVDGRPYPGDPRALPLTQHARITLEYGPPWVPPPPFTF